MISTKNKFIEIVKEHSYFRDSIDWDKLQKEVSSTKEVKLKIINNLLKRIDKHSFAVAKLPKKGKIKLPPKIFTKEYPGDIGLLELPGFFTLDDNQYSKNYGDIVRSLKKLGNKKKLIIDLSENTGGNMYPWLAALSPLYDTECVGYFEYKYKDTKDGWLISKDGVYCGNKKWFEKINSDKFSFEKIAILVSPQTSSSGEAIAMSFIGQNNVKTFGQKTAGFTTGNEDYDMGGVTIWLSTCMMEDRDQRNYPEGIKPNKVTNDPINEIIKWLNS